MMDSILKQQKHFEIVREEGSEDRISNLPTSLIGHILSFLPTKNAVATSVVSTKWKYLWTSITNLDFDLGSPYLPRNHQEEIAFINFVYRVLARNISDLQKFRLTCFRSYDVSQLHAWVSIALSRNLRELHLSLDSSPPRDLFTCRSLVVLKLDGKFVLRVPTLVCLPSLKILFIDSLTFLDADSIFRLFSSCPVLEDLSIEECDWRNISVLNISVPSLKSLTINCQTWSDSSVALDEYSFEDYDWEYKIVLNTPNLRDLEYKDHVARGYSLNKLDALVKADICFSPRDFRVGQSIQKLAIAEFVEGMSKVQWLYLSCYSIEAFQLCRPKFDHLTNLELGYFQCFGWKMLLHFVESSPRLDTLIFWGLSCDEREENQTPSCWYQPQNVPPCLSFHLKKIKIKSFNGKNGEMKMAEYFLKNSRVLEKLTINPYLCGPGEQLEICKKITMLPRASQTCQVEVL